MPGAVTNRIQLAYRTGQIRRSAALRPWAARNGTDCRPCLRQVHPITGEQAEGAGPLLE
jgi:hypothetical protein